MSETSPDGQAVNSVAEHVTPSSQSATGSGTTGRLSPGSAAVIRVADIVIASIGLLCALSIILFTIIAIKIDSPGPVIFRQKRLGQRGEPFEILKFRKFPADWGDAGPGITVAGDARMTTIGRILERTKIDEIPQLVNIIKGEMSLVGPRPETMRYVDYFKGRHLEVLHHKPGLFGPTQVAIPNEPAMYPPDVDPETYYRDVLFPRKADMVLDYYQDAGVGSYFGILIKGAWVTALRIVDWSRWYRKTLPWWLSDIVVIAVAWLVAFLVRYGSLGGYDDAEPILSGLLIILSTSLLTMIVAGVYRRDVHRFAFSDALRTIIGVTAGWTFGFLVVLGLVYRDSSVLVGLVGLLVALSGVVSTRYFFRERYRREVRRDVTTKLRVVVYGVSEFATGIGSLLSTGFDGVAVTGLIDDNEDNRGRRISGFKVLGSERDLALLHDTDAFDQLWMAFTPDESKRARIEQWGDSTGVEIVYPLRAHAFANLAKDRPQ